MGAVIPAKILGLEGQVIKDVVFNEASGRVAERLDPRQADLALEVPALTQTHELIRDVAEYGAFFQRASDQAAATAADSTPPACRQAGGEMLPRPQASLSVPDSPRRQGCAAPGMQTACSPPLTPFRAWHRPSTRE